MTSTGLDVKANVIALIEAAFGFPYSDQADAIEVFHAALSRFEPAALREATKDVLAFWTAKQRPKPADIAEKARALTPLSGRPVMLSEEAKAERERTRRFDLAHEMMTRDLDCKALIAEGLGHAVREFILEHGRKPQVGERDALIAIHDRFIERLVKWSGKEGRAAKSALGGYARLMMNQNDGVWHDWWGAKPVAAEEDPSNEPEGKWRRPRAVAIGSVIQTQVKVA